MNEADSKRLENIKGKSNIATTRHAIPSWLDIDFLLTLVKVLRFKLTNVTTERDVANLEIERLKTQRITDHDCFDETLRRQNGDVDTLKEEIQRHLTEIAAWDTKFRDLWESIDSKDQEIERLISIQPDLPTEQAAITELHAEIDKLTQCQCDSDVGFICDVCLLPRFRKEITAANTKVEERGQLIFKLQDEVLGVTGNLSIERSKVEKLEKVKDALEYTLPMAKGYAHENRVGRNAEKIIQAAQALADTEEGK